jgi:hypothetical protein
LHDLCSREAHLLIRKRIKGPIISHSRLLDIDVLVSASLEHKVTALMEGMFYAARIPSTDVKRTVLLHVMNGCPLIAAAPFQKLEIAAQDNPRIPQPLPEPAAPKLATAVRRALRRLCS